ncbi:undecaprenyl-diphosphate phosphatase [Flagellatimonas centrodinii]|uniref:undecaprenyl-diphosphate phosphatase n=1 Tax=Flagellatimonas centrodinii TaxID=2806210 RepID=UPI001FEE783B|nr:undecaprenyl-diphosphate phosphatase [Flagellatimonas centrodinii]ULQ48088.1 undecaprenyl-diphosphate phosphatase [Flagellatimonas centrodinii]
MNDWLSALLLGVIEGLTEFLPISSTGHLLIAQEWLGRRSDLFNVAIQAGAIAAVCLVYRARISELLRGWQVAEHRRYALQIGGAFLITAVLGLSAKLAGAELPETVQPIAIALIVGGLVIFAVEAWARRQPERHQVTWAVMVAVGVAQVVAGVFPGTSRSAAAIFAAMLAGLTARPRAAEFAFLVGIPTMFAATGFELFKVLLDGEAAAREPWGQLALAFGVSAATGFLAVRWLLGFIAGHSFVPFGWYRIALGGGLLLYFGL